MVSREVARHGGRPAYRAREADSQAWESALRPNKCLWSDQGVLEISRFSCMLFLSVRGFSDYAGPTVHSRLAWLPCCLPPTRNEVGILIYGLFAAQ